MLQGKLYNGLFVDIWSTGIILYAMVNGFLPFEVSKLIIKDENNTVLYKKIQDCRLYFPYHLDKDCFDMINRILEVNPNKRISFEEIKAHKFYLKGVEFVKKKNLKLEKHKLSTIVLDVMVKMGFNKSEILENLHKNNHNNITTTYYLIFNRTKKQIYYKINNVKSNGSNKYIMLEALLSKLFLIIDNATKEYFDPIQEELSTDKRDNSEKEVYFKKIVNQNSSQKKEKRYDIIDNGIDSYIKTHSKRYSIDTIEKNTNNLVNEKKLSEEKKSDFQKINQRINNQSNSNY